MSGKRKKKNTFCKYLLLLDQLITGIRLIESKQSKFQSFQSFQFKMKIELGKRKAHIQAIHANTLTRRLIKAMD